MKIGLVPQIILNEAHPRQSVPLVPLGLLSLAGGVDRARHSIEILDLTLAVRDGVLACDRDFVTAASSLIGSRGFDVVGFSTFSATFHHTLRVAAEVKRRSPSTLILFGGPQATFGHTEIIESFPVDYVVRGEGEGTFVELLQALDEGRSPEAVPGLTFRRGGRATCSEDRPLIEDLDTLPMPAFDLYPLEGHPKAAIESTRGCPFRCVYCATSNYWEREGVRRKSVARIHAEMTLLRERHRVRGLSFVDDTFTLDRGWAMAFCAHLAERGFQGSWGCSTRIDLVDDELLEALSRAGCTSIFYGIESGSERIQGLIRKNIRIEGVTENLRRTAAHGIVVTSSLMIGFPDETEEDLAATLRLRNEIQRIFPEKQAIQTHVLSPDVNTEITRTNLDRLRYDGFHSDQSGGDLVSADPEMIARHRDLFLSYYYIEPRHLSRELIKLTHCFLTAAQLLCYWSSLYVAQRDDDPLRLAKRWMEFFRASPAPEGDPAPLLRRAVGNAARFFVQFFAQEDLPAPIRELFEHEYQLMRVKGMAAGREVDRGSLSARSFAYDPRETIALIREDFHLVLRQRKKPTRIDYFGQSPAGSGPR